MLPALCRLPLVEVNRTIHFWTSGERYEFIMGAGKEALRQRCMRLHSSSQACHWLGMNYSSFLDFFFFSSRNIDHRISDRLDLQRQPARTTACRQNHLISFKGNPASFPFASVPYSVHPWLSFKEFFLPSCCLWLLSLVEASHQNHFHWISQLSRCVEGSACVSE